MAIAWGVRQSVGTAGKQIADCAALWRGRPRPAAH
jgi:hypothetical protein